MSHHLLSSTTSAVVTREGFRRGAVLVGWVTVGIGMVLLLLQGRGREVIAASILGLLLTGAMVNVRFAIAGVFVFVSLLGDFRRLLIPWYGYSGTDPLLLVSGGIAIAICASSIASRAIKLDTTLARWVFALNVIMVLQIFNPVQGPLMVGAAGAMFLLVPLLWYWVGRTYGTQELVRLLLYRIVVPLGILAACYSTYQVFFGYLPHQRLWYQVAGYAGLGDPAHPAPISFFASNTENGAYIVVTVILLWAAFLNGYRVVLPLIPALLIAIMFTGSRGPVVFALAGMIGLWAALGRTRSAWIRRGALAAVVAATGLVWTLSQTSSLGLDPHVQKQLDRQAEEFVNREEGEYSSGATHFTMMLHGYQFALREPLGRGLGATTLAAFRFGEGGYSTETAFGDSFVATGLPGGIAYHVIVFLITLNGIRYWSRTRKPLGLAVLGLLGVTFGNWIGGGLYSVSTIVLFCIGALDRWQRDEDQKAGIAS